MPKLCSVCWEQKWKRCDIGEEPQNLKLRSAWVDGSAQCAILTMVTGSDKPCHLVGAITENTSMGSFLKAIRFEFGDEVGKIRCAK